jgi:DNA-binding transcriptional ArsR family regulator
MDVTDPRTLRALAHPLRLDLLEVLTMHGPATAAVCARRLGTTQANCSFHLRQLARFGFVEEAPSEDGRERPWQLTDLEQRWSPETGPASDHFERVFVQREVDRILGWVGRRDAEPQAWRSASILGGMTLPLTVEELDALGAKLRALFQPYIERLTDPSQAPDGARFVRVLLSAVPLPEPVDATPHDEATSPADGTPPATPPDDTTPETTPTDGGSRA